MNKEKTNGATRVLRVIKAMQHRSYLGMSNKEIADGLGISAVHVSRDLEDLIAEGLVTKLDNGNFAYSIKTLQIAERFRQQQARLTAKLEETAERVNRF